MAIYDKNGVMLEAAYDINGNNITSAYDKFGSIVYSELTSLKVMQYNVGGWYTGDGTNVPSSEDAAYYALQNSIIENADSDILCIEEYWTNFSSSRTAESLLSQYYPYIRTAGGSTQYMGRAICSKHPIVSYTSNYFTVDSSRYYDVAKINANGHIFYVIVTHLSVNNQAYKIQQATEIYQYIKSNSIQPFIICGDFNSTLTNPMSETNIGIYKQYLDDECTIANDGAFGILNTACNSANWSEAFAIDNIIVSDAFRIETAYTDLTKTTDGIVEKIDHIPLIAELQIN